jgi:signal transduction histidine kinase
MFTLTLEDNGGGFSTDLIKTNFGSGLKNMESRATLIRTQQTLIVPLGRVVL